MGLARPPGLAPLLGKKPLPTVSEWMAQEATMEEQPGVLRAESAEAVAAVLGLGVCRRESWAQRGKASCFQKCSAQAWADDGHRGD